MENYIPLLSLHFKKYLSSPILWQNCKTNFNRENCQMHCSSANHRHPMQIQLPGRNNGLPSWSCSRLKHLSFLGMTFFPLRKARNHTLSATIKCLPLKDKKLEKQFKCQKSGCLAYNYGLCLNLSDISHGHTTCTS